MAHNEAPWGKRTPHENHNPAAALTVLWARILDRRRSSRPPKIVVIDPRVTDTAVEADAHLRPRVGSWTR